MRREVSWGTCCARRAGVSANRGSVVIAALNDFEPLRVARADDPVHEAVLTRDASRPEPRERSFERFGLAQAGERLTPRVLDQGIELAEDIGIGRLPMAVVLPGRRREQPIHAPVASGLASDVQVPAFASAIDASRRAALAGERSKCSVSTMPSYSSLSRMTAGALKSGGYACGARK